MSVWLPDEAATIELAGRLRDALPVPFAGWIVLLEGELGAGKSTLARALIRALGHDGPVPSPTYTLVEPYELAAGRVYHIDLYRVHDAGELPYLGLAELDDGLCLIEWPERAPDLAARADLNVSLAYESRGGTHGRRADIRPLSPRAGDLAARLQRVPQTEPED